jgi:general secretion pathway protein A
MYQRFYGLRERPFELTSNARYLFLPPSHREALSTLQYGLFSAKPLTVIIGEAGTGKTTLLCAALASERCSNVECVYLHNPTLTRDEFIEWLANRLELSQRAAQSKAALLDDLERELTNRRAQGKVTALVVDEAQSLSRELLEEIRLLANNETATDKLLPVVLAGQLALRDRLNEPSLRQLKQRVALRCELPPLTLEETGTYIATRIKIAGGEASRLFTREAVMLIHDRSEGIPRTINVICDNALVTGYAAGRRPVDRAIAQDVARDFDLLTIKASAGRRVQFVGPAQAISTTTETEDTEAGPSPVLASDIDPSITSTHPRMFSFFASPAGRRQSR